MVSPVELWGTRLGQGQKDDAIVCEWGRERKKKESFTKVIK